MNFTNTLIFVMGTMLIAGGVTALIALHRLSKQGTRLQRGKPLPFSRD